MCQVTLTRGRACDRYVIIRLAAALRCIFYRTVMDRNEIDRSLRGPALALADRRWSRAGDLMASW